MKLQLIDGEFAVCQIPDASCVNMKDDFFFLSRTDEELSLVCRAASVPANRIVCETGWRMMRVAGVLDFSLTGILSGLSGTLAEARVGIFAVSTYNTDYILVKAADLPLAQESLRAAGHIFIEGSEV